MPIVQRCPNCWKYFPVNAAVCSCGTRTNRSLRNLYFKRQINGKRHFKSAGRIPLEEARLKYAEWIREITSPPPLSSIMTLGQIKETYLQKMQVEGRTYYRDCKRFLTTMIELWGDIPANELTTDMVKRFQTTLRARGASPAYADRHIAIGRAAFNYCLPDMVNPFARVKLYRPDNTVVRFLSAKEQQQLLIAAQAASVDGRSARHMHEIILLAIHTGMRESNILRLHTDEVDLSTGTITLRQKRDLRLTVYMNAVVRNMLAGIEPSLDGWYFPNPRTGRPYGQIRKTFATIKELAGIKRPFRFHDLRHHFGTKLMEESGNPRLVMAAMGHRDISTTMKYAHQRAAALREALERLATSTAPETTPAIPKQVAND